MSSINLTTRETVVLIACLQLSAKVTRRCLFRPKLEPINALQLSKWYTTQMAMSAVMVGNHPLTFQRHLPASEGVSPWVPSEITSHLMQTFLFRLNTPEHHSVFGANWRSCLLFLRYCLWCLYCSARWRRRWAAIARAKRPRSPKLAKASVSRSRRPHSPARLPFFFVLLVTNIIVILFPLAVRWSGVVGVGIFSFIWPSAPSPFFARESLKRRVFCQ